MARFILQEDGSYLDSLSGTGDRISKASLMGIAVEHKRSTLYGSNQAVTDLYNDLRGSLPQECKDILDTDPIPSNWRDLI